MIKRINSVSPHRLPCLPSTPSVLPTSVTWQRYFFANKAQRLSLPWNTDYRLTSSEKRAIAHSIQKFQLGESSEGSHLMTIARTYAAHTHDPDYVNAVKLFIGEEQRHAKDLKQFMEQEGIALAQKDWTDSWFRRLRKCANLEVALSVLLVAELIATVYYDALKQATRSPLLEDLCTQILHDEHEHVRFQCQTLGQLRAAFAPWKRSLMSFAFQILFLLTVLLVWVDHRSVFRAGHYSFREFWHAIHRSYHWATSLITAAASISGMNV